MKFVSDQAVKAAGPIVTRPPAEPSHVYWINGDFVEADPASRSHVAADLSAIIRFAQRDGDESPAVWYSQHEVVCVVDDTTRRDFVTLPLAPSAQRAEVQSWGRKSKPFKQAELILMLRTLFKYDLDYSPNLIAILRTIRFASSSTTNSTVTSTKASIGRTIEKEVSGADVLPEEFYLDIPLFGEPFANVKGRVCVAIEMDAGAEVFTLHPVPGDLERQVSLAEGGIGATLKDALGEDTPVYYGRFARA